jgi:hypothetical protein
MQYHRRILLPDAVPTLKLPKEKPKRASALSRDSRAAKRRATEALHDQERADAWTELGATEVVPSVTDEGKLIWLKT